MGKALRVVCIVLPQLLTLASLIFTLVLILSGTSKHLHTNAYFLKINTRFAGDPHWLSKEPKGNKGWHEIGFTETPAAKLGQSDFYTVALWNECWGKFEVNDKDEGIYKLQHCSKPNGGFVFDAATIVNKFPSVKEDEPEELRRIHHDIKTVSRGMSFCFSVSLIASSVTFLVGWFGLMSRIGSAVTVIFALAATVFTAGASILSTVLFIQIAAAFNKTSKQTGITATASNRSLGLAWAATLFALASCIFWLCTSCCCAPTRRAKQLPQGSRSDRELLLNNPASRGYSQVHDSAPMRDAYSDFPERDAGGRVPTVVGGGIGHTQYGNTGFEGYRR